MTLELLPPEVAGHAPLTELCPHCNVELHIGMAEVWQDATTHAYALETPHQRHRALEHWTLRQDCPGCGRPIVFSLVQVISYRLSAVAPDPLEAFPPCSRYWEARQRGLPTTPILRLDPPDAGQQDSPG